MRLGVIGAGNRASQLIARAQTVSADVKITGIADPDCASSRRWLEAAGVCTEHATFFPDDDKLLEHADALDGIIIGTRCNIHAPLAIKVAKTGLPLYLEKPVATSMNQLESLAKAFAGSEHRVVVAFPLKLSPLFQQALSIVRSGRLGTINQIFSYNFVGYGGVYYAQWYRNADIIGGLWLQKATHDFDYINQLTDAEPNMVAATETQRIYGGSMDENLRCSNCSQAATCIESPANIAARGDDGGMGYDDHLCAFSSSIHHHDAGSAIIRYANGIHASYSQNFVTRRSAHARGARITGYEATLEFDWATQKIRTIEHHGKAVDEVMVPSTDGHNGGDHALAGNFIEVMRGEGPSKSPLTDGILSATMCLAAQDSARNAVFNPICVPGGLPRSKHPVEVQTFMPGRKGSPPVAALPR